MNGQGAGARGSGLFRRNDDLLNLMPKGVVAFPGSGITDNLVEKAVQLGIPVQKIAA